MDDAARQTIVQSLLQRGLLVSPDLFLAPDLVLDSIFSSLDHRSSFYQDMTILTKDIYGLLVSLLSKPSSFDALDVNWFDFDSSRFLLEKKKNNKSYQVFLKNLYSHLSLSLPPPTIIKKHISQQYSQVIPETSQGSVTILKSYDEPGKKRTLQDFVTYYKHRYHFSVNLLRQRVELENLLSINRLKRRFGTENVSAIGLVYEKYISKNGNIILTLEDITGRIKVFIHKEGPLKDIIPYLTYDEVVGVSGTMKHDMLFANTLLFPDVPLDHKGKTTLDEVYAVFISDVHVGSKMFLEKEFKRFISWLNGGVGNDAQKNVARKVQYLFIVGDIIDGVGIYPNQDNELSILDVYEQYAKAKELLSHLRSDISIIICPGNHDAMRIAEPQPALNNFNKVLSELDNVTLVSNPSLVRIHDTPPSEGVTVLLYHGYSYDYYISNIDPLRQGGGYNRIDLTMKYLLQKRHLAPSHTSTLYIPCLTEDPHIVDVIPDIFVSGHLHKSFMSTYNGVLLVGCSCWQTTTSFQEKVGHIPDPGRVPVVNLKTKEITMMNFYQDSSN